MEETVTQNIQNTEPKESVWKKIQTFLMKSTNGMALGLFGTLIIGTIIALFAKIPGLQGIADFANIVKGLMGAGIGLGVALALGCQGITVVAVMAAGAVGNIGFGFAASEWAFATYSDPLSCYCSALVGYFAIKLILRKKTPVDLIIIPLTALVFALAYCYLLSYWVHQ
ncbi:MAG: PTS sugar transporter subunit IIC, partial [Bacilli bacterium]|nr:PTS sugar transporter subunit IIC [Bacilli bacterium]